MKKFAIPRTLLITGATGAIGGALAEAYAESGGTLVLQGRDTERLTDLAALCETRGAGCSRGNWMCATGGADRMAARTLPTESIDLVIAAAGMNSNIGPHGAGEPWEQIQALIEVNVLAAMATVDALLPSFRARRQGQIALFSSLAASFGLPVTPSYCASKAAMKAYGEALRGWLAPEGIRVNVVMPGYVASRMCNEMPGPKPFLWPADRAARTIRRGLERDRPRISFPFPLNLGTWFLAVLPPTLSQRILGWLDYRA